MRVSLRAVCSFLVPLAFLAVACAEDAVRPPADTLERLLSEEGDCPPCDTLTNDQWSELQDRISLLEVTYGAPAACDTILDYVQSAGKDEWGNWTDAGGSYGVHDPEHHGTVGKHIGLAERLFTTEQSQLGVTAFHEGAHHLGWADHTPRSGLEGAYGAEETCIDW